MQHRRSNLLTVGGRVRAHSAHFLKPLFLYICEPGEGRKERKVIVLNRKIIIAIILLLLLVAGAMWLLTRRDMAGGPVLPFRAIPTDAVFIIKTPSQSDFTGALAGRGGLLADLAEVPELEALYSGLITLDTLFSRRELRRLTGFGSSALSFHVTGRGRLSTLLTMPVSPEIRYRHLDELLSGAGFTIATKSEYQSAQLYSIEWLSGEDSATAWVCLRPGLLLASTSRIVLEAAVRQYDHDGDLRAESSFSRVASTGGRNEDQLYILFGNLPRLLADMTSGRGNELAEIAGKLAGTAGGDITLRDRSLTIHGYTDAPDPSHTLQRYLRAEAVSFSSPSILPAATAQYESVSLSVFERYGSDIRDRSVPSLIASQIAPFLGREVTRARLEIRELPTSESMVLIYEITNRAHLEEAIRNILAESGTSDPVRWFSPDDENRIAVYRSGRPGLHEFTVPGFAGDFNDIYYTFHDNYLITGSSYTTVTRVLYDNILNRTLINDVAFRDFRRSLPSRGVYSFYAVPHKTTSILEELLTQRASAALSRNIATLRKVEAIGFQFTPGNNMLYHSLSVSLTDEVREETRSEWETLLDTVAASKPFFFTNHNTGAREIFVQDENHNAYLINSAGRVLWKVPVGERIVGQVFMIDYYRNGRLQLLFAGRNHLHLLDRNGNYVDRYPVRLRSPATSPLSLFDYEGDKNYRLFIAGEDRNIYLYDKSGNLVRGWNIFQTATQVRSEIQHFRVDGRDYIVAGDETGIYILNRRGEVRLTAKEPVRKARNSNIRLATGGRPAIIFSAPDGEIQMVDFEGTVDRLHPSGFGEEHYFEYFDITGNGVGEFLFIDKGILYIYSSNGRRLFRRDFRTDDLSGPIGFIFPGNERGVGVVDTSNSLVYVVDKSGDDFGGFPLRGASLFSIGRLTASTQYNLIVGGTDSFLYNYVIRR